MLSKHIAAGAFFTAAIALPAAAGLQDGQAGEFSEIVRAERIVNTGNALPGEVGEDGMLAAAFLLVLLDHKL